MISVSISPDLVNESEDKIAQSELQPVEPPQRSQHAAQRPDYSESADVVMTECTDTAKLEHCAYTVQEISEPVTIDEALNGHMQKSGKSQQMQSISHLSIMTPGIL